MDGLRPTAALAVVLGVLAVATVAAALAGPGSGGSASVGLGAGEGDGVGSGNASGAGLDTAGERGQTSPFVAALFQRLFSIFVLGTLVLPVVFILIFVWQEGLAALLRVLRSALRNLAVVVLVMVVIGVILWLLLEAFAEGGGGAFGESAAFDGLDVGESDGSTVDDVPVPLPLVAIGGVVLVVAFVTVLTSSVGGDDRRDVSRVTGGREASREAVAPPVSVDFSDVAATNDVYRAWATFARSVTDRTDDSLTPGEVATRAVEAGHDEADVRELTGLFRAVRYDEAPPTSDRERRARAALARLRDGDGRAEP